MMHFDEAKATQAAARLIKRAGGRMNYMKLLKLLYLTDREALDRYGSPVTGDTYYSMKQGPVLSNTMNSIKKTQGAGKFWGKHIERQDYDLVLKSDPAEVLCEADEELLDVIFEEHGQKDEWELVQFCHHHLSEWKHPKEQRRVVIGYSDILDSLEKSEEEKTQILSALAVSSLIDNHTSHRR